MTPDSCELQPHSRPASGSGSPGAPRSAPRATRQASRRAVWWFSAGGVVALGLGLFLIRLLGPCDLDDGYHQARAAAYVLDAFVNDHWICQYGLYGEVSSKPPMFTWLAALASLPFGRPTWFSLVLPSALATLGTSLLLWRAGRRSITASAPVSSAAAAGSAAPSASAAPATRFAASFRDAGFLAAVFFLLSPAGAKGIALARIDPLFAFAVGLTALAAFQAWQRQRGWTWFWLAAAFATLTKGPLGLLLGASGLAAAWWEKRSGVSWPIRGRQWPGVVAFLAITLGWFGGSLIVFGEPLLDKMLGRELVGHVVQGNGGKPPLHAAYLPFLYFLRAFAPWGLLTLAGLWRVWRRPAADDAERRFERFLACWFCLGILVFSISPHQRPDLIFPVLPAGALLAGLEASRWTGAWSVRRCSRGALAILLVGLGLAFGKYHVLDANGRPETRTRETQRLAETVVAAVGREFPLVYVDDSAALQFFLTSLRPPITFEGATRLLRGVVPVFVAVSDLEALRRSLAESTAPGAEAAPLHVVAGTSGPHSARFIVSNHPRLEWPEALTFVHGPLECELRSARLESARGKRLRFAAAGEAGSVVLAPTPGVACLKLLWNGNAIELQTGQRSTNQVRGPSTLLIVEAVGEPLHRNRAER